MMLCNRNLAGLARLGKVLYLAITLVLVTGLSLPAGKALAIDEPDSVSLSGITIFSDLLTTADFLAFVPYEITFGTNPSETIAETFIFRLISADGSTELGTVTAEPLYNSGYDSGVVSFYIESGMVSGTAYIFRVQQNPTLYPAPQYWDFVIGISNYSGATDQADALRVKVLDSAVTLTPEFGVALTTTSESGATVLSIYGELYYLAVIPGLQIMSPELFSVQLENPDFSKRTWSTTFADTIRTRYAGTFIEDFFTGYAGLFSIDTSPAMNGIAVFLFIVVVLIAIWKFKATVLSSLLDGFAFLLLMMLMGIFSMIWAGFIAFISSAIIGGGILLFKRS